MQSKKLKLALLLVMTVLALGSYLLPPVSADVELVEDAGADGHKWEVVCCGGSCSPNPHCYGTGNWTCCA